MGDQLITQCNDNRSTMVSRNVEMLHCCQQYQRLSAQQVATYIQLWEKREHTQTEKYVIKENVYNNDQQVKLRGFCARFTTILRIQLHSITLNYLSHIIGVSISLNYFYVTPIDIRSKMVVQMHMQMFSCKMSVNNTTLHKEKWGRDSSVRTAIRYGLEGPVIEFRWGRDLLHVSRPALEPTQPPT